MGRRTLFLFLGLLIIVGLIYFGSSRFSTDKISLNKTLESKKNSVASSGQVLGAEVVNGVLGSVDSLIAKTKAVIKNSAVGLVKNVGNSAKDQITEAIFGSSTPAAQITQVQEVAQPTPGASICQSYNKNQNIIFILKFVPASGTQAYAVDWGDGRTAGGNASAQVSLSHSYSGTGNYTAIFKTGSFTAQKDICVE